MSDVSTLIDGLDLTETQITKLTANLATLKSEKLLELDSDVARVKEGARMTQAGLDIIAKGNTGATIKFTKIVLGDAIEKGTIQSPTDKEILSMTKVINARKEIPKMADAQFTGGGTFTIKFQLNNAEYTEGFWCREVGLFAKDPDTNKEVLYCYKNFGSLATYVPAGDGAIAMNLIVSLITIVDQTTDVQATIGGDFMFVSEAEFTSHVNSTNPHPNFLSKGSEVTSSTYYWAAGDDRQLHPVSKSNMQEEILGGSLNSITALNSRIGQNEINIANLFMQLQSQSDLGLDANLLLVEDFSNCECIDMLNKKIEVNVAGDDVVYVDSFDGLRVGHYYTVTDGTHAQTARVKSLAINENLKAVFLEEKLEKNLNLETGRLCRTTGLIEGRQIRGSGVEYTKLYNFSGDEWRGNQAGSENISKVLIQEGSAFYTYASQWSHGKYVAFTADGCFTLSSEE